MTCELDHLEEWYLHHKKAGFENFFVYVDAKVDSSLESLDQNLKSEIKNIKIIPTEYKNIPVQASLYTYFCKKYDYFDYILFIDSDEYYQSKTNNIHEDISILKSKYGNFDALALFWRQYGANPPFENRVPIDKYYQWYPSVYFKSLVNPKSVDYFPHPHTAFLKHNSKYISENGELNLVGANLGTTCKADNHSSNNFWIKHIRFRSKSEYDIKFNRTGWYIKEVRYRRENKDKNHTYDYYNSFCSFQDNQKSLTSD